MIRAWERIGLRTLSARDLGSHCTYRGTDPTPLKRAVYLRRVQGLNAPAILDQLRRGTIHRLVQFYDFDILDLFSRTTSPGPLVRATERQTLLGWVGVSMDLLAWGDLVMEPHLFNI